MRSFLEFAASRPTDRAPAPGDATALARGLEDWTRLAEESAEADTDLGRHMRAALDEPSARLWLEAIFGNSPFLTRTALLEPATVAATMRRGPDDSFAEILAGLNAQDGSQPRAAVMQFLRRSKRRASLVAAMADLAGHWPLDGVTKALSDLAETSLRLAMRHLLRQMHATGGITLPNPDDPERDCGVVVLGMGKLGAHELNYSSDIDLIILFEAEKIVTPDIDRLQQLMTRLARDIVQMMEERTADGYAFRTDLRLRPDPGSMPPAVAMEAAETYYASVGQNWERAALIKARPVAGDGAAAQAFLRELTPFIWRKHLDFAAIRDILSIKRQIDARHGGDGDIAGHNVKLGHGGIREIEFFVQTQQLIWGGRVPALRGNRTLDMLRVLAEQQRIAPEIAEDLARAYVFLREIEHRLQMIEDLQTHSLPETEEAMQRFAIFMGFAGRAEFEAALREVFTVVRGHFGQLVTRSKPLSAEGNLVFTGFENDPETLKTLERLGFRDARLVAETVRAWHHGRIRATRSEQARALLTELVPTLLRVLGQTASPDYAFARFDEFLSHLPAGVQMLSLLQAKPELLGLMAEIMGEAPGLATYLSRKPSLLYGVLTGDFFKPLGVNPDRVELGFDLDAALAHARDFEDVLDLTRRWVADRKFQIGVQLMQGHLTADHAARHYSALGDVAISTLLPPVAEQMAAQHGVIADGRFVVLGLGKLGSQEMTAQSDLDLVFVYDAPPDAEASDGPKPLPPSAYYARFGQRLINALTAITSEGKLYEVDMALRPSGASGPIASSLEAFRHYHDNAAWTWEHMALTRARVITGDEMLGQIVTADIRAVLTRPRDPDKLLADVAHMRNRMVAQHRQQPALWDCKHRRGGLIDIEFITQYLLLRHASTEPAILATGTAEVLRRLIDAEILAEDTGAALLDALALWHQVQGVLRVTLEAPESAGLPLDVVDRLLTRATGIADPALRTHRIDQAALTALAIYDRLIGVPAAVLPKPETGLS